MMWVKKLIKTKEKKKNVSHFQFLDCLDILGLCDFFQKYFGREFCET